MYCRGCGRGRIGRRCRDGTASSLKVQHQAPGSGSRPNVEVVTLRVACELIHAVELIFGFGPTGQALRSLYLHPPILPALGSHFGSAIPEAAGVVLFGDETAIKLPTPLSLDPDIGESLATVHVSQNDVAWLKPEFRQGLQHLDAGGL